MPSEEILINHLSSETRVAIVQSGVLIDLYIEKQQQSLVGNIYWGRILRVVPSIQAAFVDIGLARAGFLHFKDILSHSEQVHIQDILHVGQMIYVQVIKDKLGTKGVRLTTILNISGRFLVLTPSVFQIAVSQKITELTEIERFKKLFMPGELGGYIFRTAAENIPQNVLLAEKKYLENVWQQILFNTKKNDSPRCVYTELSLELRVLRDRLNKNVDRILVDDTAAFERIQKFIHLYLPDYLTRVFLYVEPTPLFDLYDIEKELQKALQRTIYLKSGGYLVFDQTEAMTTIDVNSGSSLRHQTQVETAYQVNLAAIAVIAQQVRLRHLSGIIIIDFIDVDVLEQRDLLLVLLKQAFSDDLVRTEFSELTRLGLVQMTRKRMRNSLIDILCEPCPLCQCRGSIKSLDTLACDLLRAIQRSAAIRNWSGFRVQACSELVDFIHNQMPNLLTECTMRIHRPIELIGDVRYTREQYDILPIDE